MSRLRHKERTRRIPKESRTIPLPGHYDYGEGEDAGKYFRCWNCGFICDVDRDSLGDAVSFTSDAHLVYVPPEYEEPYEPLDRYTATLAGPSHVFVVMELAVDDDPKPLPTPTKSDISAGCPFCGTLNWRGDF